MEDMKLQSDIMMLKTYTDVLYLTDKPQIPPEIKRLLRQNRLSFLTMPLDKYPQIRQRLNLIGTVVIDAEDLDASEQQKLAQILESFEMENIGVILLTNRVEMPIKSFSLAPTSTSFSMTNRVESVSLDDLWVRISVNLAYRRRSSGIAVKPAAPSSRHEISCKNKLAEQLQMAGALVESLSEQLRLAGLVQQDFLPAEFPDTDRIRWAAAFYPAEWVSGDIYNIVRIDYKHIGFYVADVVGHGLPAALLTIFLKQTLAMRETTDHSYRILSPSEVMRNLNVRMASQKLSGYQFATCCYCLLDIESLQLTYARAGHPYPLLIRPEGQPEQLETRGSLLGVFEETEYVERSIQLQPGDKLLVYSDGAEPFIGCFDDQAGFRFKHEFYEIADLSIIDLVDRLKVRAKSQELNHSGIDDITIVGLEVL
jgi:serine phosphatase RsbU (regulator of sigma subunit)